VILAVATSEITSCRGYGEGFRAGIEMKEGFFLYRINMVGAGKSIDKGIERTVFILPNPAETLFPIIDLAVMATQEAVNLLIFQFFVKEGFFHYCPIPTKQWRSAILFSGQPSATHVMKRQSQIAITSQT
jgi:hypothetical protein